MKLVSHYRENDVLRKSFIQLAADIFGLDFTSWYERGFWRDRYIPFSYADGDQIVANVSVNELDLVIDGISHKALQFGTVMTHPQYRNKGLSANLMNHVLDEYEGKYDYMYLFANESVLDFYPKFGFEQVEEHQYSARALMESDPLQLTKLRIPEDLEMIEKIIYRRVPVSNAFATANANGITMYHILHVFTDHLYHHPESDAIFIFTRENRIVQLYDVISTEPVNMKDIISSFADTDTIQFHFTPDYSNLTYQHEPFKRDGALFVRKRTGLEFPSFIMHPGTSEA